MKEKHLNVELALFLVLVVCYSVSTIEHPLCTWPWRSRNNKQGEQGQNHHSTVSWGTTGFRSWINNLTVIFYLLSVLRNSTNFKYSVTFFFLHWRMGKKNFWERDFMVCLTGRVTTEAGRTFWAERIMLGFEIRHPQGVC